MAAVAAAVRMVTPDAGEVLPEADSVGAMRTIGLAFGAQHMKFVF
jgi:hypothetical protein